MSLIEKGERIYNKYKSEWEKLYYEKIIAIEVEEEKIAGVGDNLNEAYFNAIKTSPNKVYYFRKVGSCGTTSYLFLNQVVSFKYKNKMPLIEINAKGPKGIKNYEAYLDTGAANSLLPEDDAIEIGLPYVGDTEITTGSGKDQIRLYLATIIFLNKEYELLVYGRNLPQQAFIKAIIGRDILDNYEISFNGISNEVKIVIHE